MTVAEAARILEEETSMVRKTGDVPALARLMSQKDIRREYGLSTRHVLRGVAANQFPAPVRVIGKTRWFDRAEIARFFRVQGSNGSGPAS